MQKRAVILLPSAVFFLLISFLLVSGGQGIAESLSRLGFEQGATFLQHISFSVTRPLFNNSENQEKVLIVAGDKAKDAAEKREMQALRDQFETTSVKTGVLLPARVIGFVGFLPGISRPTEIVLDKGKVDGVRVGQAVIIKDNLAGKIEKVTDRRSQVALLTKNGWSFTGKTTKTNAQGLVVVDGGDIFLRNVVLSDELKKKDLVVTKGDQKINGVGFPPDLVVGEIVSVDKKASALFQTARVRSLVDITGISTVFISTHQ